MMPTCRQIWDHGSEAWSHKSMVFGVAASLEIGTSDLLESERSIGDLIQIGIFFNLFIFFICGGFCHTLK